MGVKLMMMMMMMMMMMIDIVYLYIILIFMLKVCGETGCASLVSCFSCDRTRFPFTRTFVVCEVNKKHRVTRPLN